MKDITIEVDITHRCNLACRHCNRLCNAEENYGINRTMVDMDMRHINFLISEVKRLPKGSVKLIRILGGEPLMSKIIIEATKAFEHLIEDNFIRDLHIVTNGTIEVPTACEPYVVYAPQIVKEMRNANGIVSPQEVYAIKNTKHRNITISPKDYNLDFQVCNRVYECGIHYTVFGFSYTAPCFPSIIVYPNNHKYFFHKLPSHIEGLITNTFREDVCALCCFAISNYKDIVEQDPHINKMNYHGKEWHRQILVNRKSYMEPDTSWINYV